MLCDNCLVEKAFLLPFCSANNRHCNQKKTPKIVYIEITVLKNNYKILQKSILKKPRLENGNEFKTR